MTRRELIIVAVALVAAAALLHFTHYLIFHDAQHVAIYLFGDIAFLPIEILVISIVVDRVLGKRARAAIHHKMNMVIDAFFSTLGRPLLELLPGILANADDVLPRLELAARGNLRALPASDFHHLCGDVNRLYGHLLIEWLDYMAHLNVRYPFLYSFTARTNPLRADRDVIVWE